MFTILLLIGAFIAGVNLGRNYDFLPERFQVYLDFISIERI